MLLQSKHFGEINVAEGDIFTFENGLPGFPNSSKFVLLQENSEINENKIYSLQSIEDMDVAFVLLDVMFMEPAYIPIISQADIDELGGGDLDHYAVLNIAVIPENYRETTVNLMAPIVLNTLTKKGKQVIAENEDYEIKHYVYQQLKEGDK